MSTPFTEEGNSVHVDKAFTLVGEYKKYHVALLVMFSLITISPGMQLLIAYFAADNPGWQCNQNSTKCTSNEIFTAESSKDEDICKLPRNLWKFVKPDEYSIVTQFELHCEKENLVYLNESIIFIGWALGAVLLGYLSDRYGRHKVLFTSFGLVLTFSFVSAFIPVYEVLAIFRALTGFFSSGTIIQSHILALELTTPKYRALTGIILWMSFTLGLILMGALASFVQNWKILTVVTTVPFFPFISFAKFIPESVRWTRVKQNAEDAMAVLQKIAVFNSTQQNLSGVKLVPVNDNSAKSKSRNNLLSALRSRKMRNSFFIQAYVWMVTSMAYYCVVLAASDLGLGLYKGFILASVAELPRIPLAIYSLNRFGRKKTTIFGMCVAALCCVCVSFVPQDSMENHLVKLRMALGMIGRFAVALAFDTIYIWSFELHPTVIRSQSVGLVQFAGRIGAALAPWLLIGLRKFSIIIPLSLMGGAVFMGAIVCLFLRETNGKPTAEIIEDIQKDTLLSAFINTHTKPKTRRWSFVRQKSQKEHSSSGLSPPKIIVTPE